MLIWLQCLAVESANMHGDASLVDNLVSSHLTGVTDPEPTVKAISLKGLSSIANLPQAQVFRICLKSLCLFSISVLIT